MKTNHIFFAIIFAAVSCKKETDIVTTTVQIRSSEYFSDDSIGNCVFHIKEPYTLSNYGLNDSTNEHGIYFGSFEHPLSKNFEVEIQPKDGYLNPFSKIQLTGGEHNVLDIKLIELATLQLEIECGTGSECIQNVKCTPTFYFDYSDPLYGRNEGLVKNFNSDCNHQQASVSLLSGEWIISYEWKPTPSATFWVNYSDTLQLIPGQIYTHTIVY